MLAPRCVERLDERLVEHLAERPPDRILASDAVKALQRAVPADDPFVEIEHGQAVVERLQDVLVELPHPAELLGLQVQLSIQAAVLDGGGHLAGHN